MYLSISAISLTEVLNLKRKINLYSVIPVSLSATERFSFLLRFSSSL